ncbi:hypothetical protein A3A54_02295 [Candidatus Curtissbacteria bacterium RIFCSPLOWO2_01_FULL_39_62]|uniref:Uncharacterized protein n=2 Tax=Candidatus Curtissiibacteriota TaxID=1752717 RepID=A0A1F5G8W3_9BACT|nr:MAG: hypothetical protein A2775_02695 [Candidatus Curtissbacteria bacterium RIFCSPHIGHO2_01_FULL_39_57]OGD88279.1 MAG: hypothetical protein A3D04_00670 [Candidatus Curtissbacteria bacterium RIFCSPHIGHO2_02_FULL_40_16b]OGD90343.1 MAG: hypothetical protein A3E11_00680 [Candidatus Curtissbacteria bacterium RIFCSPHIGHO2_12_FULL_38_37]OGE00067.1 MAG: hypothetical protein A3J17_05275 [Candidatus Curtissbacteria bacterium RIFCSPLOWO2_02_FULL_40_11]OGE00581.1 MAG: hypothetical protein A3A54_02295 [C
MTEKRVTIISKEKTLSGWQFKVNINIKDLDKNSQEEYNLTIELDETDYVRLTNRSINPEEMVKKSVNFLLSRENARNILTSFNLMEISKYYPDYEEMIKP